MWDFGLGIIKVECWSNEASGFGLLNLGFIIIFLWFPC